MIYCVARWRIKTVKQSERNQTLLVFQADVKTMLDCYIEAAAECGSIDFTTEEIRDALKAVTLMYQCGKR